MKTATLSVCSGCLALILTCCSSGGAGDDTNFYVSFTANGTDYVLTNGFTADDVFDSGANGAKHSSLNVYYITASGEGVTNMDQGPYFAFRFEDNTPGTYDFTGTENAGSVGFTIDGTTDYYDVSDRDFTFILESYSGEVGGAVRGSFSGTLEEYGSTNTLTITNGYFNVERLADGAIAAPTFFK